MGYGDPQTNYASPYGSGGNYSPPQGGGGYGGGGGGGGGSNSGYLAAANMGTQGTANLAGGIYNQFWGMPQYNDYLKTLPDLSGNISNINQYMQMLQGMQMPQYMIQGSQNASRQANAAAGLGDSPLGASVEAQNTTRAQQAFDAWRLSQIMQANDQSAQLNAAQRARMSSEAAQANQAQQNNIQNIAGGASGILGGGASWIMNMLGGGMGGGGMGFL